MRKIKIFYVKRTAPLYDGLDSIQQEINQWVTESGNEIVDVKMNISNNNNPVVTVIYTEPDPHQTERDSEETKETVNEDSSSESQVYDHEGECSGWKKGYNKGYHDGNEDCILNSKKSRVPQPPEGDHCNRWRKDWKEGYEEGYSDAVRNWIPQNNCNETIAFAFKHDKETKE